MKNFVLAIDQGTTGTTTLIVDEKSLEVVSKAAKDYPQHYPKPGWVEHDLNQIWETVESTVETALKKAQIKAEQISAIGITNQRETTCAYNKKGEPLHHAIVWQDRRTSSYCKERKESYEGLKSLTGLPLDPYFSATKMRWLLDNSDTVAKAAKENDLRLSTIDTYLLYRLSGTTSFATEPSNASRTLLQDLSSFSWSNDLLNFFHLDESYLPEIKESFGEFGKTKGLSFLPDGIPISCMLGDQQSALFGQAGIHQGDLKITYGTGSFMVMNVGERPVYSRTGLLSTAAYSYKGKKVYALEGACYIAGAAVQWVRDNLKFFEKSSDIEKLAGEVKDLSKMENLIFYPFFTGIASPYWVADAKGAIIGMTRDTEQSHIARACLDGIALSINDPIQSFVKDFGKLNDIKVDGGAAANNLLMQIQANFSGREIFRPKNVETTSFGAAVGSLVGTGKIAIEDVTKFWELDRTFKPESDLSYYQTKGSQWSETIKKLYL